MPRTGDVSDFWRRLTTARTELRPGRSVPLSMKQADVAKVAGVRQSAVTNWKTGKKFPTVVKVKMLAKDAGVCTEWLMSGRGPKYPAAPDDDPRLAELLALWDRAPDWLRTSIIGFARTYSDQEAMAKQAMDMARANSSAITKLQEQRRPTGSGEREK